MNLNVIRTLTIRSRAEGVTETTAAMKGLQASHEDVAAALAKNDRQMQAAFKTQQEFSRASQSMVAANDNMAKSWRTVEERMQGFKSAFRDVGMGSGHFEQEIKRLGLQESVVTGMLKKTKEGFTILQNPANQAAGAVGQVTSNLNIMTSAADPAAQSVSNFTKHLSLLGAAGVVTGVIIAIRKAMDELFEVATRAQDTRLGSTELLALQAAAVSARVPVEKLNSAIHAFTEVSKKAPDDAKEFYKALSNISPALAEAFKSAPTQSERLRIIADGFAQSTNEVQKYQLALKAFGTDNDRVIEIFDKGRKALDGYIERSREFGIVVDDAFIKKAQEAQAQLNTLVTLIQQRLTIAVVEGTLAVSNYASSWGNVSSFVPQAIGSFGSIQAAIRDVSYDLGLLAQAWAAFIRPGAITMESVNAILEPLKKIFSGGDLDRVFAVGGEAAWQSFIKAFEEKADADKGRVVNALDQALRNAPAPPAAFKGRPSLKDDVEEATKGLNQYENAIQRVKDQIEQLTLESQGFGKSSEEVLKLKTALDLSRAAMRAGIEITPELRAEIDALSTRFAALSAEVQRLNQIRDALSSIGGGFAKDMFNGVSAIDAAVNALTKLRDILIDILAKKAMTSLVGSFAESAGPTAGVTAAGASWVTAGAAFNTQYLATIATGITMTQGAAAGEAAQKLATAQAAAGIQNTAATTSSFTTLGASLAAAVATIASGAIFAGFVEVAAAVWAFATQNWLALIVAAIAALVAATSWLTGGDKKKKEEEERRRKIDEDIRQRQSGYASRHNTAVMSLSFDTNTMGGSLAAQEFKFQQEREEEARRGGEAMIHLLDTQNMERLALQQEWDQKLLERRQSYSDRLFAITNDTTTLEGQIAEANRRFIRERLEETRAGGQAMNDLVRTQEAELQAIIDNARKEAERVAEEARREAERLAKEIRGRRESFQDRQFAATNDPNTLAGQLAAFDRQALRDRRDELEAGGQAINDLVRAQEFERLNIIKDFNERALAETKRAEEDRLRAISQAARSIVDYLTGLKTGADSPLSPSARLSEARQVYDAILAKAQYAGTDPILMQARVDALGRITQDAETLRVAAQAMHGSGAAYQAIFNQIQTDLANLTAVTQSSDPIVNELKKILISTDKVTPAVDLAKGAVDATKGAVDLTKGAVDTTKTAVDLTKTEVAGSTAQLVALNTLNVTMATLLTNIKDFNANMSVGMDYIRVHTLNTSISTNESVNKLHWIAQNMQKVVTNTRYTVIPSTDSPEAQLIPNTVEPLAMGGVAPPFTNIMYGEHHPQGPFFGRTGSQPFAVTPNMPSNDNGEVVSEIRALRREHAMTQTQIARLTAKVAVAVTEGFSGQNRVIKDTERDGVAGVRARRRGRAAA